MTKPQRYTLAEPDISYGMDESEKGEYVLWRDYARLKAEVERLRSQFANSVWQPIETAPKDGTTIVGWCKESGADILFYGITERDDDVTEEGWLYHFDFQTWVTNPTHWMPLPKPPTK